MPSMLDSHTHIGLSDFLAEPIAPERLSRPALRDPLENRVEDLIARMDAHGIARAIAFGYPIKEIDRVRANEYVLDAARRYPGRIIPFMLVGDDVPEWLARGARGFKQQNILYAPERFDLPRAYRQIAEAGVPMLIHFRAGGELSVAEQARAILRGAPGLKLIVAHMGRHTPNTSDRVESALLGLADEPNVMFETSTVRDPAIIARAVEIVGPERVAFGSDNPFNSYLDADPLGVELGVIDDAGLAPDVRAAVLGGSMAAYLGLEEVA